MKDGKHTFALFVETISRSISANLQATITDKDLAFRLSKVLRVQPGDSLILFDHTHSYTCRVDGITPTSFRVYECVTNKQHELRPHLRWYLPLLEREAFEDALISLTVMGAQDIYPIITEKSRAAWGTEKERERAQRLMIAAAEQSKQFRLPILHKPQRLLDITFTEGSKLFFDAQGIPAYTAFTELKQQSCTTLLCMVGPEGDLTEQEKQFLKNNEVTFVALTPTILRASTAVCVGIGLVRSLL